jgi:ArsR family transcriptional regulator, lead/cadmium/zinc/bismuth-responsive transcriptional repressor
MQHRSAPRQSDVDLCQVRCVHPEQVAQARARLAADETYRGVAQLFGALADPTRAKIVHSLLRQELCTCDLAAVAGVTESGISQHLRILRALRMVKARRAGKFVYYRLDDAHVALLMQLGLTHQGHTDDEPAAASPMAHGEVGERGA